MALRVYKINESPRHGFKFKEVPTKRGSIYGGSIVVHYEESYAAILDCVYEMADMVATANGWTIKKAIDTVLTDEGWTILPSHRADIEKRLAALK